MLYKIGDRVMYSDIEVTSGRQVECEIAALLETYIGSDLLQLKVILSPTEASANYPLYTCLKSLTANETDEIRYSYSKFSSNLDGRIVLCYFTSGSPFLNIYDVNFGPPFAGNNPARVILKDIEEEDHGGLSYL